ncbi:hypothetical protein [Agreia sp.]|uniref:hypothetical protein n=1 Tax=Agreia sp. TaxID=1872416 RepID=UPI0035BC6BF9
MKINKVRIDGQVFFLDPEQDLDTLKADVVAAARSGADLVEFKIVGAGTLFVLVTPTIGVRFEVIERTEAAVDAWRLNPPSFDPDLDIG